MQYFYLVIMFEYAKEHILPHEANFTLSSVITNGGQTPTSIPSFAKILYAVRVLKREYVDKIVKKLDNCSDAVCKVTGCTYKKRVIRGTWHAVYNHTLVNLIYRNIKRIGTPKFAKADKNYMNEIFKNLGLEKNESWDSKIIPPTGERKPSAADDHSEFCYFCPTCRFYVNYLPGDSNTNFDLPKGAFYIMADIYSTGMDSNTFAKKFLEESRVAVAPRETFGDNTAHCVRISLATKDDKLIEGVGRLCEFCSRNKAKT